jgi:phytoene synthase
MNEYTTYQQITYVHDLNYAQKMLSFFGSNYAQSARMLPKAQAEATIIFYCFVRYADELVDNPDREFSGKTHKDLNEFIAEWNNVSECRVKEDTHRVIRSTYWMCKHYSIPFDYLNDFLKAMKQDTHTSRYQSYSELKAYMWGSASIVGHVMTFLLGYKSDVAFEHAQALAEAMQLTNFLRDVDEDYQQRNRIYLPEDEYHAFGVTEDMIKNQNLTPELINFLKLYTQRAHELFKKGMDGIKYLKSVRRIQWKDSHLYIQAVSDLYLFVATLPLFLVGFFSLL